MHIPIVGPEKILETQPAARGWNKLLVNRTLTPFDAHALKETIGSGETMAGTQSFSAQLRSENSPPRVAMPSARDEMPG